MAGNSMDIKLQLLAEKWAPIEVGFKPGPGWEGPFLVDPDQVAEIHRRNGLNPEPCWQIIFAHKAPNSRNPDDPEGKGGVQAALAFATIDELLNTPTDLLVKKMALSLAGRAAHEALEWATMDGKLVVDPHGSAEDMDEAAAFVREYLGNGATRG